MMNLQTTDSQLIATQKWIFYYFNIPKQFQSLNVLEC
jgi:hypothetical protein